MAYSEMEAMMRKPGPKKRSRKKRKKARPSTTTDLTPHKAGVMLRENRANGRPLSKKQKGFLGAVRGKAGN